MTNTNVFKRFTLIGLGVKKHFRSKSPCHTCTKVYFELLFVLIVFSIRLTHTTDLKEKG